MKSRLVKSAVIGSVCAVAWADNSVAQQRAFNIPAESLRYALEDYIRQSDVDLVYDADSIVGKRSHAVAGILDPARALEVLLSGTGFSMKRNPTGAIVVFEGASETGRPTQDGIPAASLPGESVVVTGSRIAHALGEAPTPPVTIISADDLFYTSPANVPDGLAKLPMFAAAKSSNSASDGGYQKTGNFLDLRGLGPQRTLILLDGHRFPVTYFDGTVDTNVLPQMLLQRVEVVTGGASAVYGSDAVAGVVNFTFEKEFNGIKGLFLNGVSTYGDAYSLRMGVAGGSKVGERGHFEWSAEYYYRDPISAVARPYGTLASTLVGSGTAASPLTYVLNARLNTSSAGGLVTTGPFAGLQFSANGTLVGFDRGTVSFGTPNISSGGDGGYLHPENLLPSLRNTQLFGRYDYQVGEETSVYLMTGYSLSSTHSHEQDLVSTENSNAITIYSGNPYLLPQYQKILTDTRTASFNLNRYNQDFGSRLALTDQTASLFFTAGIQGLLGDGYNWEIYYTHGKGRTRQGTANNVNTERFYAALDAVRDPLTGAIVCRSALVAPSAFPGCVPLNVLGDNGPSKLAMTYIAPDTEWVSHVATDDAAANVSGTVFDGWAGPARAALGLEYRLQSLNIASSVSDNTFNITNLRVGLDGNTPSPGALNFTKNIMTPSHGAEFVYEGNIEVDLPIINDALFMKLLSVSGAARFTTYSVSGTVQTWKLGLDWQISNDLRARASRSRDIRAPTLYDLFQGRTSTIGSYTDYLTGAGGSLVHVSEGNARLTPEVAHNMTAGFIYTPEWLSNFSASVDYYRLAINDAISSVNGGSSDSEKICITSGGASPYCSLLLRPYPITNTSPTNFPTLSYTVNENAAFYQAEGIDLEANYEADIHDYENSLYGFLHLSVMWSHQPTLESQVLPGTTINNVAGTAQAPKDRVTLAFDYGRGAFAVHLLERYLSSFHQSSDPTIISAIPTEPSYLQTDIGLTYDDEAAGLPVTWYLHVNNIFNAYSGLYQTFTNDPGMNYPSAPNEDEIGRYFTMGFRFRM